MHKFYISMDLTGSSKNSGLDLVKFLLKSGKIRGDKIFLKRGEVNVNKFRPLITILFIFMAQFVAYPYGAGDFK